MSRPRVVLLRGRSVNPWELRPWERLSEDFDVEVLVPGGNLYDVTELSLRLTPVRTVSDRLPGGRTGELATRVVGERYLDLERHLEGSDVVHAAELGYWFSWQAARLRERLGFRLVLTVWETLPFLDAYRNVRTRAYRKTVLCQADRFLATSERARAALLLEGAPEERIEVCPPGIEVERFAPARRPEVRPADGHLVLSAGRLVWEKGHQDVLRALSLLRGRFDARALLVGAGPEEARLRAHARDLGVADRVHFAGHVPYDEVPAMFARASCLVLASIPTRHWEEQFGMVLAEALASHLPVVATQCGAIAEVVGDDATLIAPGDYVGLAEALAAGPLAQPPMPRRVPDPARVERYSAEAAAARIRVAYEAVLA